MKTFSILLLFAFFMPAWGENDGSAPLNLPASNAEDGKNIPLLAGTHRIRAEIASTEESRERGLMQRRSLCRDCGMLFVFEKPDRLNFWMKNTVLPLSIAFIGADGRIINIEDMEPETLALHGAKNDALYALEMRQGWFIKNGLRPGDRIQGAADRP
jgi:uncharacterized membrane protein (UPF0127 family)